VFHLWVFWYFVIAFGNFSGIQIYNGGLGNFVIGRQFGAEKLDFSTFIFGKKGTQRRHIRKCGQAFSGSKNRILASCTLSRLEK
jgi:hypothetical protein